MKSFYQAPPQIPHPYKTDLCLRSYLCRTFAPEILQEIEPGLIRLADRSVGEVLKLGLQAEQNPPVHVPYDAWGRRIDEIQVSEAWKNLERISVEEGLVSIAYRESSLFGKRSSLSRVHQFVRVYLFGPSSAIATCPLAMTDGAARAIELYGDDYLKTRAFPRLVSLDPDQFWSSGQWMTERTGGSDVSMTSTVAKKEGSSYLLSGTKWFTSATTSQMAMTLARIEGDPSGSRGLSLFYLELRNEDGSLNGIHIHRLKDKLGTKALPTAELTLENTRALLVGEPGNGVKKISSLFNITRIWNAACALGYMRRGLSLAQDYSLRREAFGRKLIDHPLHRETLKEMESQWIGAFHLVFRTAELLGKEESGEASSEETALLRLMTPLVKLFTAKQSVAMASEVLECFGGAGYVEDTGLPRLLRDTQVLAIWEGTTNVLSLDVLRAIEKERALESFFQDIQFRMKEISYSLWNKYLEWIQIELKFLKHEFESRSESQARVLSFRLAKVMAVSLMLEQAEWERGREDFQEEMRMHCDAIERWIR